MFDRELYEATLVRQAYEVLVEGDLLPSEHPDTVHPGDLYGRLCKTDWSRHAASLYGSMLGDSLGEAYEILEDLMAVLADGRRPRSLGELLGADGLDALRSKLHLDALLGEAE